MNELSGSNVYCNRTLNMKKIRAIGLDMDHTLVRYKSKNFETLAFRFMKEKLVVHKGYPKSIMNLKFDYNGAIRGLVVDKQLGNILKLSRHAAIRLSHHGTNEIEYNEQKRIYKSRYIDLKDPMYDNISTTFSIAFANLFALLVDLKDGKEKNTLPDYKTIADDLNFVLDQSHRDGSLKNVVKDNLSDYIIKDKKLVQDLQRYLKHDKQIFIVTNSHFEYAKLLLDYAINPFLKNGKTWQDIFKYVIVNSQKPVFFYEDRPFQRLNPETGAQMDGGAGLVPGVYSGGSANQFSQELGLAPDEILYVGDHIYGDIIRLKKDCAWRTALVVEELDREIKQLIKAQKHIDQIQSLMVQKTPLERMIDELISRRVETGKSENERTIQTLMKKSMAIDKKIGPLIRKQQKLFNPYWGEVMRIGNDESYFAYQVERYACVYMAKLGDLLEASPRTYYRAGKKLLAHERPM
jgi:HAD superfamily 5'-nucleotidase-like hydrolase